MGNSISSIGKSKLSREEARRFLEEEALNYRTFSGFEERVGGYKGKNGKYLGVVVEYLRKRNSSGRDRIFGLGESEIEQILDATIPVGVS
jgi:hypothetical protein